VNDNIFRGLKTIILFEPLTSGSSGRLPHDRGRSLVSVHGGEGRGAKQRMIEFMGGSTKDDKKETLPAR